MRAQIWYKFLALSVQQSDSFFVKIIMEHPSKNFRRCADFWVGKWKYHGWIEHLRISTPSQKKYSKTDKEGKNSSFSEKIFKNFASNSCKNYTWYFKSDNGFELAAKFSRTRIETSFGRPPGHSLVNRPVKTVFSRFTG